MNFRQPPKPLTKKEKKEKEEKILSNLHNKFLGTQKKVEVTLDPKTAFPTLILSEDRKSVHLGQRAQTLPDNPERFNFLPCVLGAEGIDSGTVDWVVEVGKAKKWSIGVARASIERKWNQYITATEGFWVLKLFDGEYMASTTPSTILTLWKSPRWIKVHLDFDFGTLSFFNADSTECIFTFNYPFSERMLPFFEVWDTEIPLKICPSDP
ncbi:E3 ubiquitin-protein ligase TRIM39-like [Elgaria multicarinata webbii]|uniref:E3 ubiquitin-protein ligase TRIM39-like n=1 Tax=Elgaria multicarinata webbii TaxID=159646 RepID=UPI002FCD05B5